jgi:hypothetical protein
VISSSKEKGILFSLVFSQRENWSKGIESWKKLFNLVFCPINKLHKL